MDRLRLSAIKLSNLSRRSRFCRSVNSTESFGEDASRLGNTKKSALERHHLFPRAYLRSEGKGSIRETNQIANFTLVEWTDNIDILDQPPSSYVPPYEDKVRKQPGGEDRLAAMYDPHALPEGWYRMGYTEFLNERRARMASVIRRGFEKIV